jgi:hypothetical protein
LVMPQAQRLHATVLPRKVMPVRSSRTGICFQWR